MNRILPSVLGIAVVVASTRNANAQVFWGNPSVQFVAPNYGGQAPAIAVGTGLSFENEYMVATFMHDSPALYWMQGTYPTFNPGAGQYDNGYMPGIGTDSFGSVFDVHQAEPEGEVGQLWYRPAVVGDTNLLTWFSSFPLQEQGCSPRVAASNGQIIEVHSAACKSSSQGSQSALWYTGGTYPMPVTSSGVTWSFSERQQYDQGNNPTVATNFVTLNSTTSGTLVIEVHEGETGKGGLWCHTGVLASDGFVYWSGSQQVPNFPEAVNPSVAFVAGAAVLLVAGDAAGAGLLYSETAAVTWAGGTVPPTISWNDDLDKYDNGYFPFVSVDQNIGSNGNGMEVHQATPGSGALWQRSFELGTFF